MADSSEILPIREALTKLHDLDPLMVPEDMWLKLTELEDATYKLWARYIIENYNLGSTRDEHRQQIRDYLKEQLKKNG